MTTIIEKYIALQRKILGNFAMSWDSEKCKTSFQDDVRKFYGFENEFGWNIILNAYFVFEDTELAKNSYIQISLQRLTTHQDIGEKYLQLYGFLNAVYQQKLAVFNLMEVFKLPKKKEYEEKLNNTELVILRNKIGAHPSNYKAAKDYVFRLIPLLAGIHLAGHGREITTE